MNFTAFAESRKSVRGFQDKAVPKDVIDDIINSANGLLHPTTLRLGISMQLPVRFLIKSEKGIPKTPWLVSLTFATSLTKKSTPAGIDKIKLMLPFNYSRQWVLRGTTKKNEWTGC